MKNKIVLYLGILLLVAVIVFMARDFFVDDDQPNINPYKYDIQKLREIPDSLVCYKEINQIPLHLDRPRGIAIGSNNEIFVAADGKVHIFTNNGDFINGIETGIKAQCVHLAESGDIYLSAGDHVEIWTQNGAQKAVWDARSDSSVITSITTTPAHVFVADAGLKVVHHYKPDGTYVKPIGKKDTAKGIPGFIIPSGYLDVDIGRNGNLWVVNTGRHQFESYDMSGNLVTNWSRTSMQLEGFSGCCNPSHMVLLDDGSYVTAEKGIERVKIHAPNGDFQCVVASPAKFDPGTKGLDLAVDSHGRIIILDPVRNLVRIFEKIKH